MPTSSAPTAATGICIRTVKYRLNWPSKPFTSKEQSYQLAAAIVDWYIHEYRHSVIRFVTPQQLHSSLAAAIYQQLTKIYELASPRAPQGSSDADVNRLLLGSSTHR